MKTDITMSKERLVGSCHCGLVQLTLLSKPNHAISCNCSICRRLGAIWAIYDHSAVSFKGHPEHTQAYEWGRKTILTYRCRVCGCVSHWESAPDQPRSECGVNLNNFEAGPMSDVLIRRFDGADTWQYLD